MPQIPWTEIANKPHTRHLVVGMVEDGTSIGWVRLIEKLLRAMPIAGDYGVGSARGRPELHCAFQLSMDADLLANALHAQPIADKGDWKSQRRFVLDSDVRNLIALVVKAADDKAHVRTLPRSKTWGG